MKKPQRTRSTIEKYGYYEEYIRRLSMKKLGETPAVLDLDLSSAAIQRAYKEMKQEQYPGTIIDYLATVGGMFSIEMRIKDGSIFDWQRLVSYLENEPGEASILLRAVNNMRISDTVQLYERVNDNRLSDRLHRTLLNLGNVGAFMKYGIGVIGDLGCDTLIRRILKYQSVAPKSITSSTSSQSNYQSKTPSDQETITARRGPRPKTPGHKPQ